MPQNNVSRAPLSFEEHAFLERLCRRDEQAFCELVYRYHRLMIKLARGIVGEAFAEDCVQDAWVSIYDALPKFEGRSSLKTWVLTILVNTARSRAKRDARMQSLEGLDEGASTKYLDQSIFQSNGHWRVPPPSWGSESPQALLEAGELQSCIAKAMEQLPSLQKAVLILRDIEQESFESVCNILGITHANARVLIHRARLALMHSIDRFQETGQC